MFRIIESQVPAKQTATETINTLSNRLQNATLLEDRRAAILGLRSFAKTYPASVASGALRDLISCIRKDAEDVDTIKVVLETLLMLFAPDETSPEASEEIALWLADEFTQRQDNITALIDLLDTRDFFSRLYTLQLISLISTARPDRTQECIFIAPLGISRLVNVLDDVREPVRNEALLLLIALTPSSTELQKLVAFENAFEKAFALIEAEGSLTHGSEVVQDCLSLLANLLRLNISNQAYFRETGCVQKLVKLLTDTTKSEQEESEISQFIIARRDKNLWGLLAIMQLFLVRGGIGTSVNQLAFWQSGAMEHILCISFSQKFEVHITSKALETCADIIRGNPTLQEKFADIEVSWGSPTPLKKLTNGDSKPPPPVPKLNVIEALLKLTLEPSPTQNLGARIAACECTQAFFAKHTGIRHHVLGRAIQGHLSGNDQIPNLLSVLLEGPDSRDISDTYRKWMAGVLMFHLIFEDPEAKSMAMKVTEGNAEEGEEVITCIQAIAGHLLTGIQRGEDERISVAYLMLLCGWLFEDPDAVNDLLGEGSTVQSLLQETKQSGANHSLVPGLCSILLGIVYEFSSKDSPISRETLHQILMGRLGREQYIDKITKLRELPLVRDFEVLPQTAQPGQGGGLPGVYFDRIFIEFLKDNFSRLLRAIDRDPGLEIPVFANGIQKGISRELVDTLRAQVEDRNQNNQRLESKLLSIQQKLEQEQLDHRRTRESTSLEVSRIKQMHENLQKNHAIELSRLEEQNKQSRNELLKQHGEQLRAIDNQLKATIADYDQKSNKLRQRHEVETADFKKSIQTLQSSLDKANKDHIQDLQTAHEEHTSKYSILEARTIRLEERGEEAEKRAQRLENDLTQTREALQKAQAEVEKKEVSRKEAQNELEDLLIVFGDLEMKRNQDKKRLKELGDEVSEGEEDDNGGDEEDDPSEDGAD